MEPIEIALPAIPAGVLVLLNFFAPYATALVVNPAWSANQKRIVAIVVALVLAAIVLLIAFYGFGIPVPAWPVLLLLAITVSQASYDLVLKRSANNLAKHAGTGSTPS
jgi:hypothetical protein